MKDSTRQSSDSFDEDRMDIIGQNGNDGHHYSSSDETGVSRSTDNEREDVEE